MNDEQLLRYSRHILLPQIDVEGQQRLLASSVLVVGLGGLGSPVAMYLAAAGVGHLVLADFDRVELSNLQRQIVHATAAIGRAKVESARERLLALNPDISVTPLAAVMDDAALAAAAAEVDVIVDATDNFATRFALNRASRRTQTPLVSGAAIRFEGQVTVFRPRDPESPCYRCLFDEVTADAQTCSETGVLAPLLGVIGSLQAIEVLKLITGAGNLLQGRLLLFDAMTLEFDTMRFRRDPDCPACSDGNSAQRAPAR